MVGDAITRPALREPRDLSFSNPGLPRVVRQIRNHNERPTTNSFFGRPHIRYRLAGSYWLQKSPVPTNTLLKPVGRACLVHEAPGFALLVPANVGTLTPTYKITLLSECRDAVILATVEAGILYKYT